MFSIKEISTVTGMGLEIIYNFTKGKSDNWKCISDMHVMNIYDTSTYIYNIWCYDDQFSSNKSDDVFFRVSPEKTIIISLLDFTSEEYDTGIYLFDQRIYQDTEINVGHELYDLCSKLLELSNLLSELRSNALDYTYSYPKIDICRNIGSSVYTYIGIKTELVGNILHIKNSNINLPLKVDDEFVSMYEKMEDIQIAYLIKQFISNMVNRKMLAKPANNFAN